MAISSDNRWLVTGRALDSSGLSSPVLLWDLSAPDVAASAVELKGYSRRYSRQVRAVKISPDSRWIAAGNVGRLSLWPGGPHAFQSMSTSLSEASNRQIDDFLKALANQTSDPA